MHQAVPILPYVMGAIARFIRQTLAERDSVDQALGCPRHPPITRRHRDMVQKDPFKLAEETDDVRPLQALKSLPHL